MIERIPARFWAGAAALVAALAGLVALAAPRLAGGVAAGGLWHLASLWCLLRLLATWTAPRAAGLRVPRGTLVWALVKFPALYALLFVLLKTPGISLIGFSIGFTAVLLLAVGLLAWRIRRVGASA